MRNKELFLNKMNRVDGKLKTIRVLVTRNTTPQEIHRIIDETEELLQDLEDMVERD